MTNAVMEQVKLNLGGRDTRIPGFMNVDVYQGENVDVIGDISKLTMYQDNSVNEIYASNCLEHFPHVKTGEVLSEWFRVLEPDGKIYISVPDFNEMVRCYKHFGLTDWIRNMIWGDQIYDKAFHYTLFTFHTMAYSLGMAGFKQIRRIEKMPYAIIDCSTLADGVEGKSVMLNVEAVK